MNHGSFGACPSTVFREYLIWQEKLDYRPVRFVENMFPEAILSALTKLAQFLNCDLGDTVYILNPTTAMNAVIRSLKIRPCDEALSTDHEYGAMEKA